MSGAAQAMVQEEEEGDFTDYSPTQARKGRAPSPKKTKQVQEGGSSHPSRKKVGGPCVSCHIASKLLATASLWVYSMVCSHTRLMKIRLIKQGSIAFSASNTHASLGYLFLCLDVFIRSSPPQASISNYSVLLYVHLLQYPSVLQVFC